jgi:hypothetical protein
MGLVTLFETDEVSSEHEWLVARLKTGPDNVGIRGKEEL